MYCEYIFHKWIDEASPSEMILPQYNRLSFGLGLQFLSPICIYLCPLALDKILQAFRDWVWILYEFRITSVTLLTWITHYIKDSDIYVVWKFLKLQKWFDPVVLET